MRWHAQSLKLPCRRGRPGRQGMVRQPLLDNHMCSTGASSPKLVSKEDSSSQSHSSRVPPDYPICSLDHQVAMDAQLYYRSLQHFYPGFS